MLMWVLALGNLAPGLETADFAIGLLYSEICLFTDGCRAWISVVSNLICVLVLGVG